jgi:hypothetical protein
MNDRRVRPWIEERLMAVFFPTDEIRRRSFGAPDFQYLAVPVRFSEVVTSDDDAIPDVGLHHILLPNCSWFTMPGATRLR